MALNRSNIPINFAQGVDQRTDPKQLSLGRFLSLNNTVFTRTGRLTKRYGNRQLASPSISGSTLLTTFNDNLLAIGDHIQAYSGPSAMWIDKGSIQPVKLEALSLIRSNTNQSQADAAVSSNGLVCTVYTDDGTGVKSYKYAIADVITGQNIIAPTVITPSAGIVDGAPKVFVLGNFFVIVFTANNTGAYSLQYRAINAFNPSNVTAATSISTSYTPSSTVAFDGAVANNTLYLAWNGSDLGGAVRMTWIDSALTQHNTEVWAGEVATIMSVVTDTSGVISPNTIVFVSYYDSASQDGYTIVTNQILGEILAPTQIINNEDVANITQAIVDGGVSTVLYEVNNDYSYSAVATNYINQVTVDSLGTVGTPSVFARSVGLASEAFVYNENLYVMGAYQSSIQSTYFLLDSTGLPIAKVAYSNGGGYDTTGLPSVTEYGGQFNIAYRRKDQIEGANESQGGVEVVSSVYTQTGVDLVKFTLTTSNIYTAEIGKDLIITGGFPWMYDGYVAVEQGFHLYPEDIEATGSSGTGSMAEQQYYYQVTYEWTDNQGNIFYSAPSLPVGVLLGVGEDTVTLDIPTLRMTAKTANPVKIGIYRWSTAQQAYYEVTSISSPLLNDPTVDSVQFVDELADASIIGNSLIYTSGGVLENIAANSLNSIAIFDSRLWGVDAENPNVLWFSKPVIQGTPVEMTDLQTKYVAPNIGSETSTGPIKALGIMDDKLIIFKANAINYITGRGPDATGANDQYSEPTFITATVGCSNPNSIVFIPQGLMFESGKGIWLLGRDLSTSYIGADVQEFSRGYRVLSAQNIPGTNQVRFIMSSGQVLVYDYYVQQWCTFSGVPAISSTIYQNLHSFIDNLGRVFQENPGSYLDGSRPVLMSFKTGWLNLGGLQGFERAYEFYLLGTYITPHKLGLSIAYDYNDSATQFNTITPDNYSGFYGDAPLFGSNSPYGGDSNLEQWRVFLRQQRCQAFQISLNESFDASVNSNPAGEGFTLSGILLSVGVKDTKPRLKASRQVG